MRYPAGKPVDYYRKRRWGVRDQELARDAFTPNPVPVPDVLTCGRGWALQDQVLELCYYLRSCPGGVDTFTFSTAEGQPDQVAAADFLDRVCTRFADLAPAGFMIYPILEGHQVHLVADDVLIREPSLSDLHSRRSAAAAPAVSVPSRRQIGDLVAYLLDCSGEGIGAQDTFTFMDAAGRPDQESARRFSVALCSQIHAVHLEALIDIRGQGHLVHVRLNA